MWHVWIIEDRINETCLYITFLFVWITLHVHVPRNLTQNNECVSLYVTPIPAHIIVQTLDVILGIGCSGICV